MLNIENDRSNKYNIHSLKIRDEQLVSIFNDKENFNDNFFYIQGKQYNSKVKNFVKECMQFIDVLGFETNLYDKKNRVIQGSVYNGNIRWKTHVENKINVFNLKKRKFDKRLFDIEEHLLDSCLWSEYRKKVTPRKNGVTNQNNMTRDQLIGIAGFRKTIGLSLKKESDILILDLDCHDGNTLKAYETLQLLIRLFREAIIFIETTTANGAHIFIKLDKKYDIKQKKVFLKKLIKEHNLENVEIPTALRLPNSSTYISHDVYSFNDSYLNIACDSVIPFYRVDTDNFAMNNTFKKNEELNNNLNLCLNLDTFFIQDEIAVKKEEVPLKGVKDLEEIVETFRNESVFYRLHKGYSKEEIINDLKTNIRYKLFAGFRHELMLEIVRIGKFNNLSIYEIVDIIINNAESSKDIKKWGYEGTLKEAISMYNACNIVPYEEYTKKSSSTTTDEFYSNFKYFKDPRLSKFKYIIKRNIPFILRSINMKNSAKNRETVYIIFMEILGLFLYNAENERRVNELGEKYLIGIQVSEKFCNLLKAHYGDLLAHTDVYGIAKKILHNVSIFKQFKPNERGYIYFGANCKYNSCQQFDLESNTSHSLLNNFESIIAHLNRSINHFVKNVFANFINKSIKFKKQLKTTLKVYKLKQIHQIHNMFCYDSIFGNYFIVDL